MTVLKTYFLVVASCFMCTIVILHCYLNRIQLVMKLQNEMENYHIRAQEESFKDLYDNDYDYEMELSEKDTFYGEYLYGEMDKRILEMADRMEERRQWAEEACLRLGEDPSKEPNGWEYLINYDYQLIWCNIFKAASSSWLSNFIMLAGHNLTEFKKITPVQAARTIYHRPTGEELITAHRDPESVAFIIVRHPFERLSSAYRDKCQNYRNNIYGKLCISIVKNYRLKKPDTKDINIRQGLTPTFEEFVRFILDQNSKNLTLDVHWQPFINFCTPCQMHFDLILKLETFAEDQAYLIRRASLDKILTPAVVNIGSEQRIEFGKNTSELLDKHFSQLSKEQIDQLYRLYRYDFEIFNYTMDHYYDYLPHDESE